MPAGPMIRAWALLPLQRVPMRSFVTALLLASLAAGCRQERTATLTLRAPSLDAADTSAWAPHEREVPLRLGVKGTLTVSTDVEQLATGGIELHARVDMEATVTLEDRPCGVGVRVASARVRLSPDVPGRAREIERALAGTSGAVTMVEGALRFEPQPPAPAGDLLAAVPWLFAGALCGERLQVPALAGRVELGVSVATERRSEGPRLATRLRFEGATGGGRSADVTGRTLGSAQVVTDGEGVVQTADATVSALFEARQAAEGVTVQQLQTTTARFVAEVP
ncbi:MAG: hypothetical protein AMXMBFR64_10830 [Myxococcales bacterium]